MREQRSYSLPSKPNFSQLYSSENEKSICNFNFYYFRLSVILLIACTCIWFHCCNINQWKSWNDKNNCNAYFCIYILPIIYYCFTINFPFWWCSCFKNINGFDLVSFVEGLVGLIDILSLLSIYLICTRDKNGSVTVRKKM